MAMNATSGVTVREYLQFRGADPVASLAQIRALNPGQEISLDQPIGALQFPDQFVSAGEAAVTAGNEPFSLSTIRGKGDTVTVTLTQRANVLPKIIDSESLATTVNADSSVDWSAGLGFSKPTEFLPTAKASFVLDLGSNDGKVAYAKLHDPKFMDALVSKQRNGTDFATAASGLMDPATRL